MKYDHNCLQLSIQYCLNNKYIRNENMMEQVLFCINRRINKSLMYKLIIPIHIPISRHVLNLWYRNGSHNPCQVTQAWQAILSTCHSLRGAHANRLPIHSPFISRAAPYFTCLFGFIRARIQTRVYLNTRLRWVVFKRGRVVIFNGKIFVTGKDQVGAHYTIRAAQPFW